MSVNLFLFTYFILHLRMILKMIVLISLPHGLTKLKYLLKVSLLDISGKELEFLFSHNIINLCYIKHENNRN